MALTKKIYQLFEDIVGPENISNDPVVLASYQNPINRASNHMGPFYDVFTPQAVAVLLPACTEEVSNIIKVCNKYGLKLKAFSTGWSGMGYPCEDDTIQLDLRRMNKIIQIDDKNCFAVIEPYVIAAVLQAELMKYGLNTHNIGAGAQASPLASCAYLGPGPDSVFMGFSNENLLGGEWVLPNGEIVRFGTLGSGSGWHYGEGPGPSVRAVLKGLLGSMGAMGVITKVALKVYPWPGPAVLPVKGTIPAYYTELPDNFKYYTLGFPTWQAFADAQHKIWDAQIGYILHRQFNKMGCDLKAGVIRILTESDRHLNDLEELLEDPEVKRHTEEARHDFEIVLAGMTPRDIEWQEKALEEILAETGGWKVKAMQDPMRNAWGMLYLIRWGHKNLNYLYSGSYEGTAGMSGSPDFGIQHIDKVKAFKQEWDKKGMMVADGGDSSMGSVGVIGGGGGFGWEVHACFDSHSKESVEGTLEFFDAMAKFMKENRLGPEKSKHMEPMRQSDGRATPQEARNKMFGATPFPIVYKYQKKVKDAFDPYDLGDVFYKYSTD